MWSGSVMSGNKQQKLTLLNGQRLKAHADYMMFFKYYFSPKISNAVPSATSATAGVFVIKRQSAGTVFLP